MPKWSPEINHLSYADDTILFGSTDRYSVRRMMEVLNKYERVSGQLINKEKSYFYLHEDTPFAVVVKLRKLTGWKNKLLTYGGRYILITHVLQSMPLYLLSSINLTKGVINLLHRIFAKFFWSGNRGERRKH
ncbi:hypothetical protein H5410_027254 [Solanum commersonii]|uniref:Reverse transcriptase domain-containing protein n=1 Tax=Solanum commersonii TaxID=4109 RepID=A0A9J5YZD6_SOLCO|nr:hypothetical protein H5410_027254 [Solanum commersonii]